MVRLDNLYFTFNRVTQSGGGGVSKGSLKYQQNPIKFKEKVESKKKKREKRVAILGIRSRRTNELTKLEAPALTH